MNADALHNWERAARHFASGQYAEAQTVLTGMLERDPANAQAWLALARIDIQLGRVRDACEHAATAGRHAPDAAGLLCDIATTLLMVGAVAQARNCVDRAAAIAPRDSALQQRIALHYQSMNEHDSALSWMQRARDGGLDDPSARFCLAVQLMFHAQTQAAAAELEQCADATPPLGRAMAQLAQLHRQTPAANHLESLAGQLAKVAAGSEEHAALEFARYKEFEDLHRYEDAWKSLARANATMHALLRHDPVAERGTFAALVDCVRHLPASSRSGAGVDPAVRPVPIFIVGMPRSGTTLLDRMLGNHSQVRSAGELGTFRRSLEYAANRFTHHMLDDAFVARLPQIDYAEVGNRYLANSQWCAKGRAFYVDKLPRNWLLAPLIHRALPQARIVHMVRGPMAVAFSNFRSYFGADYAYSYDLGSLASHYRRYRDLMVHWHALMPGAILDVAYADLVADPDAELHRVFEFCGLPVEPGCADLTRNHEPVATLSATQVRDSVQSGLSDRWLHYAQHLGGLRAKIL